MVIIMIVLGVMFIGICIAMNLFSRARFKKQRGNAFTSVSGRTTPQGGGRRPQWMPPMSATTQSIGAVRLNSDRSNFSGGPDNSNNILATGLYCHQSPGRALNVDQHSSCSRSPQPASMKSGIGDTILAEGGSRQNRGSSFRENV